MLQQARAAAEEAAAVRRHDTTPGGINCSRDVLRRGIQDSLDSVLTVNFSVFTMFSKFTNV